MFSFFESTRKQLEDELTVQGYSSVHAKNIFRHIYKHRAPSLESLEGLPQKFKEQLSASLSSGPGLVLESASELLSHYDQSVKFLWTLADGQKVESVLMPEKTRITLCVSTQVGCRQACVFCSTGRMGLLRNLKSSEILAQLWSAALWIRSHPEWLQNVKLSPTQTISNIVFMGMGEPLDNTEELLKAIAVFIDPFGLAMAPKRVTVSTAGHLDGLKELYQANLGVSLALSLHSTRSEERSRLMPINKRYPLEDILSFLRDSRWTEDKPVMIQYTLMAGVNDGETDAEELCKLLSGLQAKVNLIPLNSVEGGRLKAPHPDKIRAFSAITRRAGLQTTVRYSKGQDILAACGQLLVKKS
ncbi:MAG: 23S rRNA (adenine(2503)-C(2))-methyltransferase RlmN [Oligoflexales bacterium]|nr:23S rRNA (adenine(2503)-C(2))-methyltransferase RlmN [Oligoflexales bacterium]